MYFLKNKNKVKLILFISSFILFYAPITFLYYKKFDISIFQIGLLFSINSIVTIISEIPFGLFADKISTKLSVLLGYFILLIGMIFLATSTTYYGFLLSTITIAVGEAGISGAGTVLLMDLLEDGNEIFDISSKMKMISNILGGIVIGVIFNYNMRLPFYIATILVFVNFCLYFTIKYKKIEFNKNEKDKIIEKKENLFTTIKYNLNMLIIVLLCYISIPQIMIYFPEYISYAKYDTKIIGYVYTVANLFSLIGVKIHEKYLKKYDVITKIKYSLLLIFITTFLMWSIKNSIVIIIIYLIFRIIMGWFYQQFFIFINNNSGEKYKSTMLSIVNVVIEMAFIVSDPLITLIISNYNIKITYLFASLNTLFIIIIIYFQKMKKI